MNHPLKLILCILLTTAAFADDDWQTLFNGKDLTGWKANVYPDSWSVADGERGSGDIS